MSGYNNNKGLIATLTIEGLTMNTKELIEMIATTRKALKIATHDKDKLMINCFNKQLKTLNELLNKSSLKDLIG